MKRIFLLIVLSFILASCAAPTPTVTPLPTATSVPPTAALTVTPNIPTINVDGVQVPDPKVTNPELFDLKNPDSPIVQFANAFGVKPEEVGDLTPHLLTGVDGKKHVVLLDSKGYPLLITDNESHWQSALKYFTQTVNIPVGAYLEPGKDDFKTDNIAKQDFNDIVLPIFWQNIFVFPQDENGSFRLPDSRVGLAGSDMGQFGGALLWQNTDNLPQWFKDGKVTEEQVRSMIKSIIQHYPNVKTWIPVNEPYSSDFFAKKIGYPDYVIMAFDEARKDTGASLILNDFDIEKTGSSKYISTKALVDTLKAQNLVDGIGIQMHIDPSNPPTKEALLKNFKSWGINVYITEMDVPTDNEELRAKIFDDAFSAAIESGVVKQVNIWGVGNAAWRQHSNLFDANAQPNKAFFEVEKTIIEHLSPLSP